MFEIVGDITNVQVIATYAGPKSDPSRAARRPGNVRSKAAAPRRNQRSFVLRVTATSPFCPVRRTPVDYKALQLLPFVMPPAATPQPAATIRRAGSSPRKCGSPLNALIYSITCEGRRPDRKQESDRRCAHARSNRFPISAIGRVQLRRGFGSWGIATSV